MDGENKIDDFISKNASSIDNETSELAKQRYKLLLSVNRDLDNLEFDFLISDCFDLFNINQLGRIVIDKELQRKLAEYSDNIVIVKLIEYINKSSLNWHMDINNVFINIDKYQELIDKIGSSAEYKTLLQTTENAEELDKFNENLLRILDNTETYFGLTILDFDDVKNYDSKSQKAYNVISGNDGGYINKVISNHYDVNEKKKAFLRTNYGINVEEAENLVKKYGEDIDKVGEYIDLEKEPEVKLYISFIQNLKKILYTDDKLFECGDISLLGDTEKFLQLPNYAQIERTLINIYEKCYRSVLYSPEESEDEITTTEYYTLWYKEHNAKDLEDMRHNLELCGKINGETYIKRTEGRIKTIEAEIAEYDGQPIRVYNKDPKSDFFMLIRVDGAFVDDYFPPDDFLEELMQPSTLYHGNCKSFISNNMMAVARQRGPAFGYSNISENSFLLQAPWDIGSGAANRSFSTVSAKWNDSIGGVQFRLPIEMINNTRGRFNEFVSERLMDDSNGNGYTKDKPDYVVFFKQATNSDYENTNTWKMTKQAAAQLGIPIVILDKEAIVKNEFEKHKHLKKIFLGEIPNDTDLDENQILEQLIVNFENNKKSVIRYYDDIDDTRYYRYPWDVYKDCDGAYTRYFTSNQREELFNCIIDKLRHTTDYNKFVELKSNLLRIMKNELNKQFSITGFNGYEYDLEFWKQRISEVEDINDLSVVAENKVDSFTDKSISLLLQTFYRISQKIDNMSRTNVGVKDRENQHLKERSQN